jgi:hypothetical protein
MRQSEAEALASLAKAEMENLRINVRDITYTHDRNSPKQVGVKISGYLPKKALIFCVDADPDEFYVRVIGRLRVNERADKILVLPRDNFATIGSNGNFKIALSHPMRSAARRKINKWLAEGITWFEPFIYNEMMAAEFFGGYAMFSSLAINHSSAEYRELAAKTNQPWETALALALSKFPPEIIGKDNLERMTAYLASWEKINKAGS